MSRNNHGVITTKTGKWSTKLRCIKRMLSSSEFIFVYPNPNIDKAVVIDGIGSKSGLMSKVVTEIQSLPTMRPGHMRPEKVDKN